jgi:cysteine protease ATG4
LENQKSDKFSPILIIVPLRLGLNELNPIYFNRLKKCLEIKSSMGIMGGKPNQALYFIGYVNDEILYLDPHSTQRSGSVGNKETIEEIELDETYHQKFCGRMTFSSMDPSIAVSFLCKTKEEFDKLIEELQVKDGNTPLFEVIKTRSNQWISASSSMATSKELDSDLNVIDGGNNEEFEDLVEGSEEEFEIIE